MQFTGIHLNLFNVFRINIGKFSSQDIYSTLQASDRPCMKRTEQAQVIDLTSTLITYDSESYVNQWPVPKGVYIDLYV